MLVELAPFLVLAAVLVLFGLLLRRGMTFKRRTIERARAVAAAADTKGYRPARADPEAVWAAVREMPLSRDRRLEIEGLLVREGSDGRRFLVDYVSRGRSTRSPTRRGTLFLADLGAGGLPPFVLHGVPKEVRVPELVVEGLRRVARAGYPDLRPVDLAAVFPGPPPCVALAADPGRVQALLAGDIGRVLAHSPGWGLESGGHWLLAEKTRRSRQVRADADTTLADLAEFEAMADAVTR